MEVHQLLREINSLNSSLREVQKQALNWHDFLVWLKEEKEIPVDELLLEYSGEEPNNHPSQQEG